MIEGKSKKAKVKSKNTQSLVAFFVLTIIEAKTRAISSASFNSGLHEPFDSSPEASGRRNQYNVSRASLSAILYLLIKSARLCPACASSTFAPTEVPDLNNCCTKVRNDPGRESRLRHKRTISSAKLKVLSFMSRGDPASFTFTFLLLPFAFTAPLCLSAVGDDGSLVRRRRRTLSNCRRRRVSR